MSPNQEINSQKLFSVYTRPERTTLCSQNHYPLTVSLPKKSNALAPSRCTRLNLPPREWLSRKILAYCRYSPRRLYIDRCISVNFNAIFFLTISFSKVFILNRERVLKSLKRRNICTSLAKIFSSLKLKALCHSLTI